MTAWFRLTYPDRRSRVTRLLKLAEDDRTHLRYLSAVGNYRKALRVGRTLMNHEGEAAALFFISECLKGAQRWSDAAKAKAEWASVLGRHPTDHEIAVQGLIDAAWLAGHTDIKAAVHYASLAAKAAASTTPALQAHALSTCGRYLGWDGRFNEAIGDCLEALPLIRNDNSESANWIRCDCCEVFIRNAFSEGDDASVSDWVAVLERIVSALSEPEAWQENLSHLRQGITTANTVLPTSGPHQG